jgi:hypothetical protein
VDQETPEREGRTILINNKRLREREEATVRESGDQSVEYSRRCREKDLRVQMLERDEQRLEGEERRGEERRGEERRGEERRGEERRE